MTIAVVVAGDQPKARAGLRVAVEAEPDLGVAGRDDGNAEAVHTGRSAVR